MQEQERRQEREETVHATKERRGIDNKIEKDIKIK